MAHPVTEKSKQNLKKFSSEYQPAKAGRKASKLNEIIRDCDLSSKDVSDLAKMVLGMSEDELIIMANDKKQPIIARIYANAALQDIKNKNLYGSETLMNRTFGKPREMISLEHSGKEGGPIQINVLPAASAIVAKKDE